MRFDDCKMELRLMRLTSPLFISQAEPSYDQCDTAEPAGPSLPPPASAAQASQLSTHIHAPTQPSSSASASAQYAYSASAQYAYSASAQYAYSAPTDYYTSQYPSYHPDSGTAPGTDTSGEIPEYAVRRDCLDIFAPHIIHSLAVAVT